MKATETKIEEFLASNKTQFIIPVYQRNYDWSTSECKKLFEDIMEVGGNINLSAHFIGSIVYVHDDVYTSSRIKELTIIDGQQRLTTITLIYIALFKLAKVTGDLNLESEIHETYLTNKFGTEEEKVKLRPTENNDKALKYLLRNDSNEEYNDFSRIIDNFNFFYERINTDNYKKVMQGLSKLMFVEVSLDREKDDPQRIFESLNSTGLELSQADLIRNYILMGLGREIQSNIYQNYWEIIEKLAKDETKNISRISDFIRDYLTLKNKKIPNKAKVYQEFKIKFPTSTTDQLKATLSDIKSLAKYYNKLINPRNEPDKEIRTHLEYIGHLEINVAYPFLMKVYQDYGETSISKETFIEVLNLIQSFTWRRFIIGLPTGSLNKIFMNLYDKVDQANYLGSIIKSLVKFKGNSRFPLNTETINAMKEKDVYNIHSKNRTYLFERLENFENREPVIIENNTDITIEHIFPQNPDPKWKEELGLEAYEFIYQNYLNTLANLTLSGNNGKLGNRTFTNKRDLPDAGYKDSRLWLNKYLSGLEKWNRPEIEGRFELLAERLLKIWNYPEVQAGEDPEDAEVSIFEAEEPRNKKLDYVIFLDQRLEFKEVSKLYLEVFRHLFQTEPQAFINTEIGQRIGLTRNPGESNTRQALKLNDTYSIEGNMDSNGKFDRIKQALTLFGMEEELLIKYA